MQFHVYEVKRKKGSILHLHTPSCKRNESMKKKGASLWKIDAPYVEEARENFVITSRKMPLVMHTQCCRLFHRPVNTNPPCTFCQSPDTRLLGKLSPGHHEYACKSCSKTFVIKKERIMKVRISKSSKSAAKKLTRDQRKAARAQARADRKAARLLQRQERKTARAGRLAMRIYKMIGRLGQLVDIDGAVADAFIKELAVKTNTTNPLTGKTTKTAKAKTIRKPKKAAPLKKVAYAPATNQVAPKKAAAKKTSRKK